MSRRPDPPIPVTLGESTVPHGLFQRQALKKRTEKEITLPSAVASNGWMRRRRSPRQLAPRP